MEEGDGSAMGEGAMASWDWAGSEWRRKIIKVKGYNGQLIFY